MNAHPCIRFPEPDLPPTPEPTRGRRMAIEDERLAHWLAPLLPSLAPALAAAYRDWLLTFDKP